MALEFPSNLNLEKDIQEILKVFLNDDNLLKFLTIAPISASDDVTTRPSIIDTKNIQERFNEYYLGIGFQPVFINWGKAPEEDSTLQGRICFYPTPIGLQDQVAPTNYIFDVLLPYDWHVKTNVTFKVLRRVVELLKYTHTFGNVGKVGFAPANAIFTIPNYAGYHIVANTHNFVG